MFITPITEQVGDEPTCLPYQDSKWTRRIHNFLTHFILIQNNYNSEVSRTGAFLSMWKSTLETWFLPFADIRGFFWVHPLVASGSWFAHAKYYSTRDLRDPR